MKKAFFATVLALVTLSSFAASNDIDSFLNEKQELDLSIPKDVLKGPELNVVEKYDSYGVFYDVEINSAMIIVPTEITAAVGVSSPSKRLEAEVFAGLNAIRLLAKTSSGSSVHIPYGARVRVALNEGRTVYVEYAYRDVADFGNKEGLYEIPHTLSILKMDKKRETYYGCGIGTTVHHAWSDETHAPEKSLSLFCRAGKRF